MDNLKEIREFIHAMASKKPIGNKASRRLELDNYKKYFQLALDEGYLYNRDRKDFMNENEYGKLNILGDFIRVNNTFKGLFTDIMLDCISQEHTKTLVEFMQIMLLSFHPSRDVEEFREYYDKYIENYKELLDEKDIKRIRNRKFMQKLFDLLTKGGMYFEKGNKVLCIYSLFFKSVSINSELYQKALDEGIKERSYDYYELELEDFTIENLIKNNYLNKNHFTVVIKHLLPRDFYIPKKKRKKRVYTEDKKYLYISVSKLPTLNNFLNKNSYSPQTDKIVRDKKSIRKRYIPKEIDHTLDITNYKLISVIDINKLNHYIKEITNN